MATFQDMPPPGGFATIKIERTFAKPLVRQGLWYGAMMVLAINGLYVITEWRKRHRVLKIEQSEHYIAAEPFLIAEQERKFLRQLRIMREEEKELMKDHPGWKLGTLYGEPIFKTIPKDQLPPVSVLDWTVHRPNEEFYRRVVAPDQHQ